MWSRNYITDEQIIEAVKLSKTMSEAAAIVKLKFETFKRRAQHLDIYKPNQYRKGIKRSESEFEKQTIPLEEILNGKHPSYNTSRLRKRLIKAGLKENKCEEKDCTVSDWKGKSLTCELHHIDGDRTNHKLNNLQIICPNCHSQTDSFARRK